MRRFILAALAAILLVAVPAQSTAHTSGGSVRWEANNIGEWTYVVYVCDTNMPSEQHEDRIKNAIGEWNEIGGELHFSWTDWDTFTCNTNYLYGAGNVVRVILTPLSGGNLGHTDIQLNSGRIDEATIRIDNDGWGGCGDYSWYTGTSGPGANQVDFESVLVHEFGHAFGALGHTTHLEQSIMDDNLTDIVGGCPERVEKDERVYFHDTELYGSLYGYSH